MTKVLPSIPRQVDDSGYGGRGEVGGDALQDYQCRGLYYTMFHNCILEYAAHIHCICKIVMYLEVGEDGGKVQTLLQDAVA